jgi:hypothetical protein
MATCEFGLTEKSRIIKKEFLFQNVDVLSDEEEEEDDDIIAMVPIAESRC